MSSILATTLFATYAAAQLTTSIWLPGAANTNVTFIGSVIKQDGDHTTLSIGFEDPDAASSDGYYSEVPATVTIGGETFVAYEATAMDTVGETDATVTVSLGCTRKNNKAVPTCTMSTAGIEQIVSELCAGLATESDAMSMEGAEYCTDSAALTPAQTMTLSGDAQAYVNNFPLIITAGTEKLDASAAATPTTSGAKSTGSASGSGTGSPTKTGSSQSGAASSGSVIEQSTAAAPMMTMAPALAGLGAAAAAFFL